MDYLSKVVTAAVRGEKPPPRPKWNKWLHRNLSERHCEECLKLDRCWFAEDQTPQWPHHTFCHCVLEDIPYSEVLSHATAKSDYSKFDPYLFDVQRVYSHNKEKLFNEWGYTVEDAAWLQQQIEQQGLQKYISGDYTLGRLNEQGQRISIRVEIPRKDSGATVSFITGWMVHPDGHIQLTTPYGGK